MYVLNPIKVPVCIPFWHLIHNENNLKYPMPLLLSKSSPSTSCCRTALFSAHAWNHIIFSCHFHSRVLDLYSWFSCALEQAHGIFFCHWSYSSALYIHICQPILFFAGFYLGLHGRLQTSNKNSFIGGSVGCWWANQQFLQTHNWNKISHGCLLLCCSSYSKRQVTMVWLCKETGRRQFCAW